MNWNDYSELDSSELERRINYDFFLMKQPGIYSMIHRKIVTDRKSCEAELNKRMRE